MLFRSTGNKQTLALDGCEVLGLLKFKGKSEATSKIGFRVAGGEVIARSRNGAGAELFVRGSAPTGLAHEFTVDSSAFAQIKIDPADTITISLGAKPRLELKHANDDEPSIEFPIHRHLSTQIAIGETVQVPERPLSNSCPYSLDHNWSLLGMLKNAIGNAGSNRVRIYTTRDGNDPLYVEFGQERTDGKARWFATFRPYVDDDEALQDQGRQVVSAATKEFVAELEAAGATIESVTVSVVDGIDDDADPAGGDDEE